MIDILTTIKGYLDRLLHTAGIHPEPPITQCFKHISFILKINTKQLKILEKPVEGK